MKNTWEIHINMFSFEWWEYGFYFLLSNVLYYLYSFILRELWEVSNINYYIKKGLKVEGEGHLVKPQHDLGYLSKGRA